MFPPDEEIFVGAFGANSAQSLHMLQEAQNKFRKRGERNVDLWLAVVKILVSKKCSAREKFKIQRRYGKSNKT